MWAGVMIGKGVGVGVRGERSIEIESKGTIEGEIIRERITMDRRVEIRIIGKDPGRREIKGRLMLRKIVGSVMHPVYLNQGIVIMLILKIKI